MRVFIACIFACISSIISAEEFFLSEAQFNPSVYNIGDRVQLSIKFNYAGSNTLEVPQIMPETDKIKIESISITHNLTEYTLNCTFIPYSVGTIEIPSINLGAIDLEGMSAYTSALLSENDHPDTAPIGQSIDDFYYLSLIIQIIIFIAIPIAIFLSIKIILSTFEKFQKIQKMKLPFKTFEESLHNLVDSPQEPNLVFSDLIDLFKIYLENRFEIPARATTISELIEIIHFKFPLPEQINKELNHILSLSNEIKFAGMLLDKTSLHAYILQLNEAGKQIESGFSSQMELQSAI